MKKRKKLIRIIWIVVAIIAIVAIVKKPNINEVLNPLEYKGTIKKYANENEVDMYLIAAIIKTESSFDSEAVSNSGAIGLMQIMPDTGTWISNKMGMESYQEQDLFDPEINIKMGSWYIKMLMEHFGNLDLALAAYNGGIGNVEEWLKNPEYSDDGVTLKYIPFKETREYVVKVKDKNLEYKEIYGVEDEL